jgi:hypothetical protein
MSSHFFDKARSSNLLMKMWLLATLVFVLLSHVSADEHNYPAPAADKNTPKITLCIEEDRLGRVERLYFYYLDEAGKRVFHGLMVEYKHDGGGRKESVYQNGRFIEGKSETKFHNEKNEK